MPALKEFRENAGRSILVDGDIDEKLVHKLTSEICRLRGESSDPITVYINSRGGFTFVLNKSEHCSLPPIRKDVFVE